METLWGNQIPLSTEENYIGVLCDRISSKLICGEVPKSICRPSGLDLQLIAQAGGIGEATGFSPTLMRTGSTGIATDIELIGVLRRAKLAAPLNITTSFDCTQPPGSEPVDPVPVILVLGSGTDVGKTTIARAIIERLSKITPCAAIKASGTGWYEDSELHRTSGAQPALTYTFAGLPTTYGVSEAQYLRAMQRLYYWVNNPREIPRHLRHPYERDRMSLKPSVVVIEHGGDILEGHVPTFLTNPDLMRPVQSIILCSESALSLAAMCEVLRRFGVYDSKQRAIYGALPYSVNPEGFLSRVGALPETRSLKGILDVAKPSIGGLKARRCGYTRHYDDILSVEDFIESIATKKSPGEKPSLSITANLSAAAA